MLVCSFACMISHVHRHAPKTVLRAWNLVHKNYNSWRPGFCKFLSIQKSAWHNLIDYSLLLIIHFPQNFLLAKKWEIFSWQHFLVYLSCHFYIFTPDLVRYSVKIIRNNWRLAIVLKLAKFRNQWEVSELKIQ